MGGRPYSVVVAQELDWARQIEALMIESEEQQKTRLALLAGAYTRSHFSST
jgi:hypothetical protein